MVCSDPPKACLGHPPDLLCVLIESHAHIASRRCAVNHRRIRVLTGQTGVCASPVVRPTAAPSGSSASSKLSLWLAMKCHSPVQRHAAAHLGCSLVHAPEQGVHLLHCLVDHLAQGRRGCETGTNSSSLLKENRLSVKVSVPGIGGQEFRNTKSLPPATSAAGQVCEVFLQPVKPTSYSAYSVVVAIILPGFPSLLLIYGMRIGNGLSDFSVF